MEIRKLLKIVTWIPVLAAPFLFAGIALAHALPLKSEPENGATLLQAPERVTVWFSQELDTRFSLLQVFDAGGRQVDLGDGGVDLYDPDHASLMVSLPETLPDGRYLVRWSVVSFEDNDTTEGEFSFSVGRPNQVPTAATTPTGGDWPLAWLATVLVVLLLIGLGLALRWRVKANLVLMIGLAGLVLWAQPKISPAVSAAPLATQTISQRLQLDLSPAPTPIAPLVSAQPPAELAANDAVVSGPLSVPLDTPAIKPTPFFLIHTVEAGETLISIATKYKITTEKLLAANDIRDPTALAEGQKLLIPPDHKLYQGEVILHELREGDTLIGLASKYGSSVKAIQVANPHLEFDSLSPGETITIPVIFSQANPIISSEEPANAIYHIVQSGETPLAIAAVYDIPVEILLAANHIDDPTLLQIGQKLMIPPHEGIGQGFPVILYELAAGDTLVGLASRFGSSLKDILAVNPDLDPASLEVDQEVAIPVIFAPPQPKRSPSALRPTSGPPPALVELQQQVIAAVNSQRESHKLSPYLPNKQLSAIALAHAQDMVVRDFLTHVTPDGKTLQDRLIEGGIKEIKSSSENIQRNARSYSQTAQAAVDWFMNSPPHRYNLLNEQYTHIGVSVVEGTPGWYTFVLVFTQWE
jgi:uncharacterized protein YkwD/methionine-rich copper-binding protein CopC